LIDVTDKIFNRVLVIARMLVESEIKSNLYWTTNCPKHEIYFENWVLIKKLESKKDE